MSENPDQNNIELISAVEQFIDRQGWHQDGMTLTDVLVVAVRRGFDARGGKSITNTIVPTETSVPGVLGMVKYADIRYSEMAKEGFHSEPADEEDS